MKMSKKNKGDITIINENEKVNLRGILSQGERIIKRYVDTLEININLDSLASIKRYEEYRNKIIELMVNYNKALFFNQLLNPRELTKLWEEIRRDTDGYKVNFLLSMSSELYLHFEQQEIKWDGVCRMLGESFNIHNQSKIIDKVMLSDLYPIKGTDLYILFKHEAWVIPLVFIYYMDSVVL